jgi:serine/threonine protein kinase
MEGGELYEEIVKRKTFSEKDAAEITRQLCEALAYLHERGIVHRDLKVISPCYPKKNAFGLMGPSLAREFTVEEKGLFGNQVGRFRSL